MPQIGANFQFTSRQPNFERDQFDTVAHMAECIICDEGHKCYCLETRKTYEFTSVDSNGNAIEPNETTGYWHEFSSGGSGDITGATIGSGASEQTVTKVGTILKFPAYPTVPITGIKEHGAQNVISPNQGIVELPEIPTVSINSIAKKTSDTNPITPNQGRVNLDLTAEDIAYNSNKTVKGKLNDIDKLIKDLTPDPSDNESSSTIIDLNLYSEWEDDESEYHSFIYDSSAIYVYSTSSTSQIKIISNNTPHAIFKVSDRDIYIDYIISTSGNDTIYTANAIYDSSTLPSDFKKQFELGVYALIYRIIGRSGDNIPYGKTIIADTDNKVLNVVYRDIVDSNVTKHQLIARAFDKNRIYIYETPDATYTKGYKFKVSYGTSDSEFNDLNELFGASSANYNVVTPTGNVTSYSIANPTKNTYYDLTSLNLTSLALTSVNLTNINEVVVKFTTDSTNTCTISAPANVKFIGNSALYKGTTYVLAMLYGVICICEAPSLT